MMKKLGVALCGLVLLLAHPFGIPLARADVAPLNECSKAGEDCETAPPDYKSAGVCTKSACSRRQPSGETVSYECNLCVASGRPAKRKGLSSCSALPTASSSHPGIVAALGLLVLGIWGRRSRRSATDARRPRA